MAKARVARIRLLATCNLTQIWNLSPWTAQRCQRLPVGSMCLQNLCSSRRQRETCRPFLGMNIQRVKSFSNRSDIWFIRAGFISLVKQQFKGFSEVHKGKGDLWSVKSNDWEWHQVCALYQQSLLQYEFGLAMKTGTESALKGKSMLVVVYVQEMSSLHHNSKFFLQKPETERGMSNPLTESQWDTCLR